MAQVTGQSNFESKKLNSSRVVVKLQIIILKIFFTTVHCGYF
jgi:hypothetical protein